MKQLPYYLLDVFTKEPFGGNPLAVFPHADDVPVEMMQRIANELNLSETTFIQKARAEGSDCTVRIFTPKSEIPMAGHPTIGTAHTILKHRLLSPINDTHLIFDEGVGPIKVEFEHQDGEPSPSWHPRRSRDWGRSRAIGSLSLSPQDFRWQAHA
ncbi:MAG: trans-2,3-dihydro-3-hydroxyanthranilate isomerase [Verrucomicrobiales bacterium]|jgi:trans-2,3-dihydro-3-hydroxyanthranilate isomerase